MRIHRCSIAIALVLVGCAQQPAPNLGVALKGIEKSRFLACSGPPLLELPQGGQDRMSFVTNLKRGEAIGSLEPDRPRARFLFGGCRI